MAETADPQNEGRRQGKSAAAFRTISEVATDLDVPPHVLRFWESKFAQVRPLKRGGGRRYYRPEDVELLRGIRELLYTDGYTIKGVQKLLREGGVKSVSRGEKAVSPGPPAANGENASAQPGHSPLSDEKRAVLREVLDELVSLRDILRK